MNKYNLEEVKRLIDSGEIEVSFSSQNDEVAITYKHINDNEVYNIVTVYNDTPLSKVYKVITDDISTYLKR